MAVFEELDISELYNFMEIIVETRIDFIVPSVKSKALGEAELPLNKMENFIRNNWEELEKRGKKCLFF